MAKKPNNVPVFCVPLFFCARLFSSARLLALSWLLVVVVVPRAATACPFCTALEPTLCQQRESAAVTALAEVESQSEARLTKLKLHKVLSGSERLTDKSPLAITLDFAARPGALVLLFGDAETKTAGELSWRAVAVSEIGYGYFVREPGLKMPTPERLRYFARYLEHADAVAASDAYLEFGHATFDDVARVVDVLPAEKLRAWLVDPKVPQTRKGFYGMALGLAADAATRRSSGEFLRQLILAPQDDFRAGFDGILGGYLLLTGTAGLDLVEERYLANPRAADGDVRHAMVALRFYHEFGREIPPERLQAALARLLKRPEFAAAAITDLARWQAWNQLDTIAALYAKSDFAEPAIRRAIVGYLLACPQAAAARELARLRQFDPEGVAAAEQVLSRTSSVPVSQ